MEGVNHVTSAEPVKPDFRHPELDARRMMGMWRDGSIVGKTVKRRGWRTSVVQLIYSDIPGGVRLQDRLDGFYSWNVAELELVE
jgi:hypothetical protein